MEKYPEISVVIPVYNCEKYVGEAIESILCQPYKNIDIVLVNDGSSDSSAEICDRYAQQNDRIHVLHQENAGVSAARNAGIEYVLSHHPDAAYIAFLYADDAWYPDSFSDDTCRLLQQGHTLVGLQSCNCNNAMTRRNAPAMLEAGILKGGPKSVWKHSKQSFGSMLYSAKLIRDYQIRFAEGLKYAEDSIFRMQCLYLADTVALQNQLLYLYRHSPSSAVHRRKYGITYFTPIIDAWMESDQLMAAHQEGVRPALWEGRAMAAVCIVDMAEEHYQHWGSKTALEQLLQQKPEYLELITGSFAANRPDSGLRWHEMNAHPVKCRVKCHIKGIARSVMRGLYIALMKIPVMVSYIEKKRYPIGL